jgi:hypothetical protein
MYRIAINIKEKRTVLQVGQLLELNRDAQSKKNKKA